MVERLCGLLEPGLHRLAQLRIQLLRQSVQNPAEVLLVRIARGRDDPRSEGEDRRIGVGITRTPPGAEHGIGEGRYGDRTAAHGRLDHEVASILGAEDKLGIWKLAHAQGQQCRRIAVLGADCQRLDILSALRTRFRRRRRAQAIDDGACNRRQRVRIDASVLDLRTNWPRLITFTDDAEAEVLAEMAYASPPPSRRQLPMLIWVLLIAWIVAVVSLVRFFPKETEARRRLAGLSFIIVPWGLAILSGPFVINHHGVGTDIRAWMMTGQYAALVLSFVVAAVGIVWSRGARRYASAIGVANIILVFLLVSVSVTIIAPGS